MTRTNPFDLTDLKKGNLLGVKAPPYYKDEYIYEVTSAGEKVVRAVLRNSPRVRKSWTNEELKILLQMDIVRLVPQK